MNIFYMKYFDECKKLFDRAINDINYNNIYNETRKLDEIDYFDAYLHFIDNSIHYSRFNYSIKGIPNFWKISKSKS
jgi:hypothetical protein